ncbi:MAG: SPOR domain-containing protein [Rhodospirillales bacterium]|jgi:hypothetical protein|nr:SPOR domain-containing protein [Rhodospirillales bacterium]MDP6773616.1 SPOR domain-containing protein [Rhodospirillales bacterium]
MAAEESGGGLGETPEPPEFEPMRQPRPGRRWKLRLFLLFLVLAVGGAGAGWVYLDDLFPPDDSFETPLIRADASPVKVRPISPGGMDVPNRDKLVYGRMEDGEQAPSVERLLPPPETPLPPPGSAAPAPEPETTGGGAEEVASGVAPAREVAPPPAVPAAPPPTAAVAAAQPPPAVAAAPPAPAPPPPEPVVRREAPKKPFKVQLGAVRSPQRASQEWERLRRKHGDLLRRMELSVTKADLGGEKGVFYRMRAGPIADVATARDICAKLAIRKVGCLVVLPGE